MGHVYLTILASRVTGITLAHTDVFVRSLKRLRPRPLSIREDLNYRLWRLIHLRQHRVSLLHSPMVFVGQTQHTLSVSVGFFPEFSSANFTGYYSYHSLFLFKCVCVPSHKRTAFVPFYHIYLTIQKVKSTLINMSTCVHHVNMADLAIPANSTLHFGIFSLLFLQISFVFVSIFSIYSQAFCRQKFRRKHVVLKAFAKRLFTRLFISTQRTPFSRNALFLSLLFSHVAFR